jgi:hypothetical protein
VVHEIDGARIAPNWTSAAGALEGVLDFLGAPLPRHGIMGITGHAWHLCLGSRDGIVALPSGPSDLDWEAMAQRYARTGVAFERFGGLLAPEDDWPAVRGAAVEWAIAHLDAGRPLIGWDFHLHEHAVVYGYDREREAFLVDDVLTPEVGPLAHWRDWPSAIGAIELLAPVGAADADPLDTVIAALGTALDCFAGRDGPEGGQARGTAALDAWAAAMDGDVQIDRAGNAYTLAVLQAARMDGATFLEDLAAALPEAATELTLAARAVRDETTALSPLLTLFPFPSGGHGNVANAGLRRAAAMALRRAAQHERAATGAIKTALRLLQAAP